MNVGGAHVARAGTGTGTQSGRRLHAGVCPTPVEYRKETDSASEPFLHACARGRGFSGLDSLFELRRKREMILTAGARYGRDIVS